MLDAYGLFNFLGVLIIASLTLGGCVVLFEVIREYFTKKRDK